MQKNLIALALAGLSSAAFAQSTVTISGNIDLGYQNTNTETAAAGKDTRQQWAGNGSSTSTLVFSGTEALGGGMTAGFLLASDYTAGANQNSSAFAAAGANQMFNSQNYFSLGGNWGTVKVGTVNNTGLDAGLAAQPMGTAIGGGYSGNFSRLRGMGNAGDWMVASALNGGTRLVRSSNSFKYESPSFSGFSATLVHVFKNDNDQYGSFGQQELGLKYNNGPINVVYDYSVFKGTGAGTAATTTLGTTGGVVTATAAVAATGNAWSAMNGMADLKHNMLSGNYTFGPATVYAGWTSSKGMSIGAGDTVNSRSWNIALKYAVGNWALMANFLKDDDKLVADVDRKLTGLGVDYSLSKRTTSYVRYENGDNNTSAASGSNTGAFTRWAAGVRHTF
jgi:predicted porin